MKQKLISLLLTSALLTSVCGALAGCDIANFGKKEHGVNDHDWEFHEVVKEKTCTQNGVISYSCSCGESKTKIQQSDGHQCDNWNILTKPTCQQEGVQRGVCKVCEEEISEAIPVVDHQYVNGVCKWCNDKTHVEDETIGSGTTQASNGLVFTSNGDGTCYVSGIEFLKSNTLTIPSVHNDEKVTAIGINAFAGVTNFNLVLTSISIPATVTEIANYTFLDCAALQSITVHPNNPAYCAENGVLYNKTKTKLVFYPECKEDAAFILPQSVTTIGDGAFGFNCYLIAIYVFSNLKTIEANAFKNSFCLSDVYYEGSKDQWQSISIGANNYGLAEAFIYSQSDPDYFYSLVWDGKYS